MIYTTNPKNIQERNERILSYFGLREENSTKEYLSRPPFKIKEELEDGWCIITKTLRNKKGKLKEGSGELVVFLK